MKSVAWTFYTTDPTLVMLLVSYFIDYRHERETRKTRFLSLRMSTTGIRTKEQKGTVYALH